MTAAILAFASVVAISLVSLPGLVIIATGRKIYSVPIFVPPLVAAAAALSLSPDLAPALAYTGGTLGTLIGGDRLSLGRLRGLGAPIVSIGGAGTFDGIFLTGIIAVLLA